MSLETIRKEYEKYGFTDFEKVNKEFELTGIELEKWDFLKSFCRATNAQLGKFIGYTTPLFMPGNSYAAIVMGGIKDKAVIEGAQQLYKELMVVYHENIKAELASEKEQIAFLKDFLKKYPDLKKRILVILNICEDVFKQESLGKKETKGYLG